MDDAAILHKFDFNIREGTGVPFSTLPGVASSFAENAKKVAADILAFEKYTPKCPRFVIDDVPALLYHRIQNMAIAQHEPPAATVLGSAGSRSFARRWPQLGKTTFAAGAVFDGGDRPHVRPFRDRRDNK